MVRLWSGVFASGQCRRHLTVGASFRATSSVLCAVLVSSSLLSAQARQEVDCSAANTRVAQTVCTSPDLVALAQTIADAYTAALSLTDSPASEVRQRFDWLQRRDRCNSERGEMLVSCVRSVYELRATEISSRLDALNAVVADRLGVNDQRARDVATQRAQAADTRAAQQAADARAAEQAADARAVEQAADARAAEQAADARAAEQAADARAAEQAADARAAEQAADARAAEQAADNRAVVGWLVGLGAFALFFLGLIALVLFYLFFLPTIIAFRGDHRNRWVIFLINCVFGATVLGWIGALIWAMNRIDDPLKGGVKYDPQAHDPMV